MELSLEELNKIIGGEDVLNPNKLMRFYSINPPSTGDDPHIIIGGVVYYFYKTTYVYKNGILQVSGILTGSNTDGKGMYLTIGGNNYYVSDYTFSQ